DEGAGARVELHDGRDLGVKVLSADTDPRAFDLARAEDLLGHPTGDGGGYGEADTVPALNQRIDAEDAPIEIAERSPGVARVNARVRLEIIFDLVHAEAIAPLRTEHAGGHRVAQPERRPDGDDPLANARRLRVGELRRDEPLRIDLDDREVGRRVAPDEAR